MSTEKKLYNLEVQPPLAVWEKIAAELDQSELSLSFPTRLKQAEVIPPLVTWNKIAEALDNSSLLHNIGKRLDEIEVAPPVAAWNKIQTALDSSAVDAPKRKTIPWIRYAAAAAVLALIAWGGMKILNTNNKEPSLANTPVVPAPVTTTPVITPVITNNLPQPVATETDELRNDAALEASKKTFAKLDAPRSSKIKQAANFYFAAETDDETTTRGFTDYPEVELESANVNNRYIVFMTPEGNIIRMSKKLSDLVCCVSGEIEEQDCVDQMKKWREKIAYTTAGHSPGNFLEILNLVCSLEEE